MNGAGVDRPAESKVVPNRPWRMGWGFKNGKLSAFGDRDIVVLRGWPVPMAWRRTRTKYWQPTRKYADSTFRRVLTRANVLPDVEYVEIELPPANVADGEKLPFEQYYYSHIVPREREMARNFLADTPDDVLSVLGRHTDRLWHLYCLFARCPGSVSLAMDDPILAYALASCWVFHKPEPTKPMRAVRSLLRKPVPSIWEWLGFPSDPMAVGMYSWIQPSGLTIKRLLDYRRAMWNPDMQQLLFDLGPLDWECLELIITPWISRLITPALIQNLSRSNQWDLNLASRVKEALIYIRGIEKTYEMPGIPSFACASDVFEYRSHLEAMTNNDFLSDVAPD